MSSENPSQPSTPRHLKRLSLSVSSSSSSPYNTPSSTPRTPFSAGGGSGSIGRNSIPMRLSLSGGAGASGSGSNTPTSAPPNGFRRTSLSTSSNNENGGTNWNYPVEESSPSTSTANPNSNSGSPTTTRSIRQSRRTSSISYSSSRDTYNNSSSSPITSSLNPFIPSPRSDYNSLPITGSNSNPNLSPILTTNGRTLLLNRDNGTSRGLNERYTNSNTNGNMSPPTSATLPLKGSEEEQEDLDYETENMEGMNLGSSEMKSELSQNSLDGSITRGEAGGMRGGGMGLGNPSTITELNSDLLSFIAKKERKCLDLREELKRHEEELKGLKKKWETIVAKSVAAASAPSPAPPVTLTPTKDTSNRRIRSNNSSNNPIPRSPQHALDLSLLSSTFDSSLSLNNNNNSSSSSSSYQESNNNNIGYGHGDLESELVETAQAAKAWMGGVLGKVLDAVAGADGSGLDPLPSPVSSYLPERRDSSLDQVTEEDEEDEEEGEGGGEDRTPQKIKSHSQSQSQSNSTPPSHRSSEASVSSLDDWHNNNQQNSNSSTRASKTSITSTSSSTDESSSSFFGQFYSSDRNLNTHTNINRDSNSSSRISDLTTTASNSDSSTPTLTSQDQENSSPSLLESESSTSATSSTLPPPTSSRPLTTPRPRPPSSTSVEGGHNRRRSTFDILGSAAGGGWNSLGKKWAQVSVAASGVADSFERKLTETLGPLEGSSPQMNHSATLRGGAGETTLSSPNSNQNHLALPSLPIGVGAGVFSSWKTTTPQVIARRDSSTSTSSNPKKAKEDWDWTSFLDGPTQQPALVPSDNNNTLSPRGSLSRSTTAGEGRGGHTSRKPSVMNLFDDLAASNNLNNNSPSYYSTHDSPSTNDNSSKLPPPLSPTIITPSAKINSTIPTTSNSPRSPSRPVRRSSSTPQIDVDKEIDEWGKW